MKNKRNVLYGMIILLAAIIYFPVLARQKHPESVTTSTAPKGIVRNVIQDRKGNIWMAAFRGIFRYDGKSFTNITGKVSSARFFSVFEDRKGNLWFGAIGAGVFMYDGRSFRNFTTKDGLAGNDVTCIYEDNTGIIWFGTNGGASRYDGKFIRNFTTKEGLAITDINSIIKDKKGNLWFATGGDTFVYDGKKFTIFTHDGKPFENVRSIIQDKKGNTWLGGNDGLWRYNGSTFTNFTQNFVGYVYEDKKGNIWTASDSAGNRDWALSRYDAKYLPGFANARDHWVLSRYDGMSLSNKKPTVTEIKPGKGMICGIIEAKDGSIWFGASTGVYRYDGKTIAGFKAEELRK